MSRYDRRAYAPPAGYTRMAHRDEPDAGPRRQGFMFAVMFVVLAAFSGFVWNSYGGGETPRIEALGEYKIQPPPGRETQSAAEERAALNDLIEGEAPAAPIVARAPPEEPLAPGASQGAAAPARAASVSANGPYVAQVAALRSEAAAPAAWARVAARAPALFSEARMDVQRADLGARGVYFRVRAGYFPDRAAAAAFCDRVRAAGTECMAVAR